MTDDPRIGEIPIPKEDHPLFRWFCPKPTVRILFYTDDFSVLLNNVSSFGVGILRDLIVNHNTFYANFDIHLLNRHDPSHAANKLTPALLSSYDQVWFFGVRQANLQAAGGLPAEPENELTGPEVTALQAWMGTGGVLITGDHANPRPSRADPALDPLVNLGRALGYRVPRAGELRRWEGLPDASILGSHNTQVPDGVSNLNDLTLQDDALPQALILKRYPLWSFPPWLRRSRPHPLFCGRKRPITVFPDHMHEGELVIPTAFPAGTWPSGVWGQPLPEVIARGTDKRNGNVYGVSTAYEGSAAGVGRIVADSTWHHYFNINLQGFPPGPVLDDIADHYVNLAVWLSPPGKRWAMRCWTWWWLAHNPSVQMVFGHPLHILGFNAYNVLGQVASQCTITEFVWPFPWFAPLHERYPWPPEEFVLGGILQQYHEAFELAEAGQEAPGQEELIVRGLRAATEAHMTELRATVEAAQNVQQFVEEGLRFVTEGRESIE
jgi:hypothetical protein